MENCSPGQVDQVHTAADAADAPPYVTQAGPLDIVLGRGVPLHRFPGNVQFRALVASRKREYMSTGRQKHKQRIARELFRAIKSQGTRCLRQMEASDRIKWNIAKGFEAWTVSYDDDVLVVKIKQALREHETAAEMATETASELGLQPRHPHEDSMNDPRALPVRSNDTVVPSVANAAPVQPVPQAAAQLLGSASLVPLDGSHPGLVMNPTLQAPHLALLLEAQRQSLLEAQRQCEQQQQASLALSILQAAIGIPPPLIPAVTPPMIFPTARYGPWMGAMGSYPGPSVASMLPHPSNPTAVAGPSALADQSRQLAWMATLSNANLSPGVAPPMGRPTFSVPTASAGMVPLPLVPYPGLALLSPPVHHPTNAAPVNAPAFSAAPNASVGNSLLSGAPTAPLFNYGV